jgi:hypothetical protein
MGAGAVQMKGSRNFCFPCGSFGVGISFHADNPFSR